MSNARFGLRTRSGQISDLIQGLRIVPPLLDDYPNAAAAYSLRKLRTAYTGSAIRVRRSSDNIEQDIVFDINGDLDTSTLSTFCSGTNGFVVTWYDQSGNGRNATQATAANQPQIVSSGSVITDGLKPTIYWDGSDRLSLVSDSMTNNIGYFSLFGVSKLGENTSGTSRWIALMSTGTSNTSSRLLFGKFNNNYITGGRRLDADSFSGATSSSTYTLNRVSNSILLDFVSGTIDAFFNSSLEASSTTFHSGGNTSATDSQTQQIGASGSGSENWLGNIQELIFYTTNQSSNRTGIETNINDYYAIY